MITIEIDNILIEKIGIPNGISISEIEFLDRNLRKFFKDIENNKKKYRFIYNLDDLNLEEFKKIGKNIREKFDYFVLIGIGGSSLGTEMLFQSLKGFYHNLNEKPKFFVLDNIDTDKISEILNSIDLKRTFFYVVSKSGKTIETITNFLLILDKIKSTVPNWKDHFMIASDNDKNFLGKFAKENEISFIQLDKNLGGRFSVLSAVGLIPAAVLSIDIESLIQGAKIFRDKFFDKKNILSNPSALLGAIYYIFDISKNKNILVLMPYSDRLSAFIDWFRQLWAESLGKKGLGQTPVKSIGTLDQHSQLQLYIDGRKDKIITFFNIENRKDKCTLPQNLPEEIKFLNGIDTTEILKKELLAVKETFCEKGIPNLTIHIDELNSQNMGKLIMLFEIATAFAGHLYKVNPFDQPAVDETKKFILKHLKSSEDKEIIKGKYLVTF